MVNNQLDPLDHVFAALAHPARRGMLERLARGPAPVGELAGSFRMSAPAISRHLRVLEAAGLVTRQVDGRVHRMELEGGTLMPALAWLDHYHRFWATRLDRLAALLEAPPSQETPAWNPPPALASPSASNARSPRRRSRSSTRSRKPRR